ncbi:MAG: hypothetical protein A2Y40_08955 [Candidatus Margulisbacteria bacterium GWF2_35_9]|nr:MAG: hypothetical protein A2Y40_08955 [Candidatus Margulisbacteria bacterium GWF2_35_9]
MKASKDITGGIIDMNKKIASVNEFKHVTASDIIDPMTSKLFSMLDDISIKLIGEKSPTTKDAYSWYKQLYEDDAVNTMGYHIPKPTDIFTADGRVFLNKELRMQSIILLDKFVKVYFKNDNPVQGNEDKAKIVLSVLKLSAKSAFDAIKDKIAKGSIDPNRANPSIITLAGTGNPTHYPHILTMLEALAYSDRGDYVEFMTHAIDRRKDDLFHFFHRFDMSVDTLKEFYPLIKMHELDKEMHQELRDLAKEGVEVNPKKVTPDTAFSISHFTDNAGTTHSIDSSKSKLNLLTADGESKFYRIMKSAIRGIEVFLSYISGSDHRNILDTNKNTLGLMLDTVSKLALKVKQFHNDPSIDFNKADHHVAYLCNVRDPKELNNQHLLKQLGMIFLGLEKYLLDPEKITSVMADIFDPNKKLTVKDIPKENYEFIRKHMNDYYAVNNSYIEEALRIDPVELMNRPVLYNIDDRTDKTQFTMMDVIKSSGVNQEFLEQLINSEITMLYTTISHGKRKVFDEMIGKVAVSIMQKALGIKNLKDDEAVTKAIEKFLGIELNVNYASPSFSSTQVRNYFSGQSTENWAALFLPVTTIDFIDKKIHAQTGPYIDEANEVYGIKSTIETIPDAGIKTLLNGKNESKEK